MLPQIVDQPGADWPVVQDQAGADLPMLQDQPGAAEEHPRKEKEEQARQRQTTLGETKLFERYMEWWNARRGKLERKGQKKSRQ